MYRVRHTVFAGLYLTKLLYIILWNRLRLETMEDSIQAMVIRQNLINTELPDGTACIV